MAGPVQGRAGRGGGALTHLHPVLAKHGSDAHRHRHDGTSVHVHWAVDRRQVGLPCWSNLGMGDTVSYPGEPRERALSPNQLGAT